MHSRVVAGDGEAGVPADACTDHTMPRFSNSVTREASSVPSR
ncbi:hypothetical protein [Streptomyces sp. MG]|nr:hypothetical protein [Streptomyces sp. MG]